MALRFELRADQLQRSASALLAGESSRKRSGASWTLLTTTSRSPSLSRSAKAAPRPAFGVVTGGPSRSVTSSNRPFREIAIDDLPLLVSGLGLQPLDLGIDVAVDEEQVEPAVVIEIEEPDAPPEPARVQADRRRQTCDPRRDPLPSLAYSVDVSPAKLVLKMSTVPSRS